MTKNKSQLLTVKQSAIFLSVSVSTVRRWAQAKQIIGLKVGTRGDWRFTKNELLKMVTGNDGNPVKDI